MQWCRHGACYNTGNGARALVRSIYYAYAFAYKGSTYRRVRELPCMGMVGAYLHLQPEEALHKALRSSSFLGAGHAVWHRLAVLALGIQADLHRQLWVRRLLCGATQQRPVNGVEQLSKHLEARCVCQATCSSSHRALISALPGFSDLNAQAGVDLAYCEWLNRSRSAKTD